MTEEEARQKWCPMVRVRDYGEDEPATNRDNSGRHKQKIHTCLASDCMMWVWTAYQLKDEVYVGVKGRCGLTHN